jgi:hypothetical protein
MEIELNSIARYSLRVSSYVEAAKPALVFLTPVFLMQPDSSSARDL